MDRKQEIKPILEELRRLIRRSDLSQRKVEEQAGFSKGYLSQLLAQNLDLKVWHVLAILDVFAISPVDFFETIYPRERGPALDDFVEHSAPLSDDIDAALGQLYRIGVDSLTDLRRRLARCEQAVGQLERNGLVALPGGERLPGLDAGD